MTAAKTWNCGRVVFGLERTLVMGILNVTPDSFSDGGLHNEKSDALGWAVKMAEAGADIIDVGGESTRPGALPVTEAEELGRVIPVIETLAREGLRVSVDTSSPAVMREAWNAGAVILNDVRGFEREGALEAAASTDAGLIIMHGWDVLNRERGIYGDGPLTGAVKAYLRRREDALAGLGVSRDRICWDPGFGFGKTVPQNFGLLADTASFVEEGRPFLMALSRKSSLGAVTGQENASERISASVAGALLAAERGAQMVRVHDVPETVQALRILQAVRKPGF